MSHTLNSPYAPRNSWARTRHFLIALPIIIGLLASCAGGYLKTPEVKVLPPVSGSLFFDVNGSGLKEKDESPLSNIEVCLKDRCVSTDANGNFSFPNPGLKEDDSLNIKIRDNNQDPKQAMRYINLGGDQVKIDSQEIFIPSVMGLAALPAQYLNHNQIISINEEVPIKVGRSNELGLMKGFLTMHLNENSRKEIFMMTYADLDPEKGAVRDWKGNKNKIDLTDFTLDGIYTKLPDGVIDEHVGTDWFTPSGTPIVAMADGYILGKKPDRPYAVHQVVDIKGEPYVYVISYENTAAKLVNPGERVERGQILAISGMGGELGSEINNGESHTHIDIQKFKREMWEDYNLKESYMMFPINIIRGERLNPESKVDLEEILRFCPFENRLFTNGSAPEYPLLSWHLPEQEKEQTQNLRL